MNTKPWLICTTGFVIFLAMSSKAVAQESNIGFQSITVLDTQIDQEIDVALWYPTDAISKEEQVGPTTLQIALDAPSIPNIKGMVLISHGFSGSFLGHSDTAAYLAQNGYVVVTPTHPDEQGLAAGRPELDPLALRPRQLRLLLDELLAERLPETNNIAIIGFSLGAYTALSVLGATPDLTKLETYCSSVADELLCSPQMAARTATKDQLA